MNHPFAHGHVLDYTHGAAIYYCRKCGEKHRALNAVCDGLRGGYTELEQEIKPLLKGRSILAPVVEEMAARGRERRRFELVKAALSGVLASPHFRTTAGPDELADNVVQIADEVMKRLEA